MGKVWRFPDYLFTLQPCSSEHDILFAQFATRIRTSERERAITGFNEAYD